MADQIKFKFLANDIRIITNPEVIKVKTMKKKYVEQLPFCPVTNEGYAPFDFLGHTEGYLIIRTHGDQVLRKILNADYSEVLVQIFRIEHPEVPSRDAYKHVNKIFDQIPKIFVD